MAKRDVNGKNPAVAVATAGVKKDDEIHTLSTGVRVRLEPVSTGLIQKVTSRVKDPKVPIEYDKERDRELSNPTHPDYIAALREAEQERANAGIDAMIMFGMVLVDEMPPVETWGPKLKFLGIEFDETSPLECEFAYKKYIAMGNAQDSMLISTCTGISKEAVAEAVDSFRRAEGAKSG